MSTRERRAVCSEMQNPEQSEGGGCRDQTPQELLQQQEGTEKKRLLTDVFGHETAAEGGNKRPRREMGVDMEDSCGLSTSRLQDLVQEEISGKADTSDQGMDLEVESPGFQTEVMEEGDLDEDDNSSADSMDLIAPLPELVQDKIIGNLKPKEKVWAAQVCELWRQVIYRPRHWCRTKVTLETSVADDTIASLKKRRIGGLQISHCKEEKLLEFMDRFLSEHLPLNDAVSVERKKYDSLKELGLSVDGNPIVGLSRSLSYFPDLVCLDVTSTMSDDLVAAIGRELQHLKKLSLKNYMVFANLNIRGFLSIGSLEDLSLNGYQLQNWTSIERLQGKLKKLSLQWCDMSTNGWDSNLSQLTSLVELEVTHCTPPLASVRLKPLSRKLMNLQKFTFAPHQETKIDDKAMKSLAKLPLLQELDLGMTHNIKSSGIGVLKNLKHLKALELDNCSGLSAEGIKHLGEISTLEKLTLRRSNHGVALLQELKGSSCQLQSLHLSEIHGLRRNSLSLLASMLSLKELSLERVKVGKKGMKSLQKGKYKLQALKISHCNITVQDLMLLVQQHTSLVKLIIRGEGMEGVDVSCLRSFLPKLEECSISNDP